ncbi:hypothetical protein C2G38_2232840 [Gigaspora rosea]|uniref:Uncharacterized protein n=1 Tax=Gigaspora rosea TaxID=44941 RepID=A0A397TVS3_9GLOM|nr:hypothetical protein C2G38_2232840 [Gigaspora rosea]
MAKRRQYNTKILSPGIMDPQLHYGIWSKVCFVIAVLSDNQNPLKSVFQCTCSDVQSEPESHLSTAVNTCYKRVFGTNTEHSGLAVIGFDNEAIIQELITDISFFPIFLRIEKLNVVIPCIGNLDENRFYGVSTGFVSMFTMQSICINTIIEKTPDEIWNLVEVLKKFTGSYLFGITNELVQEQLHKLKSESPKCTDWMNRQQLEKWAMFIACGCTNVTPVSKKESSIEFWSKAPDPIANKELLETLYKNNIIQLNNDISMPIQNSQSDQNLQTFWNSFRGTLTSNKKGSDGIIRILSIIALNVKYRVLIKELSNKILECLEKLKRYLRRGYEEELVVETNGRIEHDPCISHCLPYAFGECINYHEERCTNCNQLFEVLDLLYDLVRSSVHNQITDAKEQLLYFLSHQTQKVYLNAQFNVTLNELKLEGISKLFFWSWPVDGRFSGYICARSLPNIREWNNFAPADVSKLWNITPHRLQPTISEHTVRQSTWTIPINENSVDNDEGTFLELPVFILKKS